MLFGPRLLALRMFIFLSLSAYASPSYALGLSLDAKAQGLAHYILAFCHDLNGERAQAIVEYQKSVRYNGLEPAPRLKLGAYYFRLDEFGKAAAQLQTVTRLSPQLPEAHYLLALIYSSEHQYDSAASEYEFILKSAARNDPDDTDAYLYLGQLYYAQAKYPQAIGQFLKVTSVDPENTTALDLLGSVYADSDNSPRAIEVFRKVLQIDPENSEALNSLGYIYAEIGVHLDEAVRMIRQAIENDPSNGAYYDSLGWAFYKKGMYKESLLALQKAGAYIDDEILDDHIGDVYKALKEYTLASQYWQKSLDLDPHQVSVQQKIKALKKCIVLQSAHRLN